MTWTNFNNLICSYCVIFFDISIISTKYLLISKIWKFCQMLHMTIEKKNAKTIYRLHEECIADIHIMHSTAYRSNCINTFLGEVITVKS